MCFFVTVNLVLKAVLYNSTLLHTEVSLVLSLNPINKDKTFPSLLKLIIIHLPYTYLLPTNECYKLILKCSTLYNWNNFKVITVIYLLLYLFKKKRKLKNKQCRDKNNAETKTERSEHLRIWQSWTFCWSIQVYVRRSYLDSEQRCDNWAENCYLCSRCNFNSRYFFQAEFQQLIFLMADMDVHSRLSTDLIILLRGNLLTLRLSKSQPCWNSGGFVHKTDI